ncbi:MAG: AAA family ATPase [Desulfobacteraceae bacterium]|nr:AAA family ATPase [Desulfobacteraceae bacterium]
MARADLLVKLIQYGLKGDRTRLRKVVESIIAEERSKQHKILAAKLESLLHSIPSETLQDNGHIIFKQRVDNLFIEVVPQRRIEDLILPIQVKRISLELVQEHHRRDLLRSFNLEPRNRLLLIGPPGNGKTSLAEAVAEALMLPMLVVRYDSVVGTYLGETATRLRRLIDYASTRNCVLFFDEFETLGKERGDIHETGEIKRVVSSLLMQIDALPSHVVVIAATNHPELLDRAVWRRFQIRMVLPQPTRTRLADWFRQFEKRINIPLGYSSETLAKKLFGINFAEAEEFGATVFRQYVLDQPSSVMKSIVLQTLKVWNLRSAKTEQQDEGMTNGK